MYFGFVDDNFKMREWKWTPLFVCWNLKALKYEWNNSGSGCVLKLWVLWEFCPCIWYDRFYFLLVHWMWSSLHFFTLGLHLGIHVPGDFHFYGSSCLSIIRLDSSFLKKGHTLVGELSPFYFFIFLLLCRSDIEL